jgi:hypothetical protein
LTTERLAIHADNFDPITVGPNAMVWIITSLLESSKTVESNKQRQLKQLPDEMRNRKPMSGAAETYPVSDYPKHKVYGIADSQDVLEELSRKALKSQGFRAE